MSVVQGRTQIFKIHSRSMSVEKDIRWELLARMCPNCTGLILSLGTFCNLLVNPLIDRYTLQFFSVFVFVLLFCVNHRLGGDAGEVSKFCAVKHI